MNNENTYDKLNKLTLSQLQDLKELVLSKELYTCSNYQILESVIAEKKNVKSNQLFLELIEKVL